MVPFGGGKNFGIPEYFRKVIWFVQSIYSFLLLVNRAWNWWIKNSYKKVIRQKTYLKIDPEIASIIFSEFTPLRSCMLFRINSGLR